MRARTLMSVFATLCLVAVQAANAQQPNQTSSPSIAIISFSAAVLQTAEAQRDLAALEKKYAPRQAALKSLNDDIETIKRDLAATPDKLTPAERKARSLSLDRKRNQLERDEEDLRNDSQADAQQIFQTVAQKVYVILQDYARQHNYTAVIERGSEASPSVWYSASNTDITDQITKLYDAPHAPALPSAPAVQKNAK